jgi:hypothetical protein
LFVEAHEGFYTSIKTKTPIIQNVRKWLASSPQTDVTSSQIIDLKEIEDKNLASLSNFKIITWYASFSPKSATRDKLLTFIKNRGLEIFFVWVFRVKRGV